MTMATRWVWPRRRGGRWQSTRVLRYPTTGEGCDSCEPNNVPFPKRAVPFRTQGSGSESEMAATVARYLLHYVNIAPLKSSARRVEINRRRGRHERHPIGNTSICQRVTSWNGEGIFFFFFKWTCPYRQSRICQNCAALANLIAATCYVTSGKTIALKQDLACKNRRDSAPGRRGGVTGGGYADIERYGCYPSILLLARSPMRPSTSTRNSALALSRSATRFSGDPGKTII